MNRWEPHQNIYDGSHVKRGGTTTAWVVEALERQLPTPEISPSCKKKGHDWTEPVTPIVAEAEVVACRRCFKRGLLVLETRAA